jgi:uncharacterized protein (TIRG00374 family)
MSSLEHSNTRDYLRQSTILFLGLVVAGAIFSYLFQHVTLEEVLDLLRNANRPAIGAFVLCSLLAAAFRCWRYKLLLASNGHHPSTWPLFLIVLVRNFFTDFLPARLGSLIYVFLVNFRLNVPYPAAAASFSLAMIFDLLAVAPIILVGLLFTGGSGAVSETWLITGTVVLALGSALTVRALPFMITQAVAILSRLELRQTARKQKVLRFLEDLRQDVERSSSAGILISVFVLSFVVRLCKYAGLYFFLYALLAPLGYTWSDLNPAKVTLGFCAAELAASLPISGIAGFGVYEGTWAMVFEFLGFPAHIAKLTGISHHLFTQVYACLMGGTALFLLLLPMIGKFVRTQSLDRAVQSK